MIFRVMGGNVLLAMAPSEITPSASDAVKTQSTKPDPRDLSTKSILDLNLASVIEGHWEESVLAMKEVTIHSDQNQFWVKDTERALSATPRTKSTDHGHDASFRVPCRREHTERKTTQVTQRRSCCICGDRKISRASKDSNWQTACSSMGSVAHCSSWWLSTKSQENDHSGQKK